MAKKRSVSVAPRDGRPTKDASVELTEEAAVPCDPLTAAILAASGAPEVGAAWDEAERLAAELGRPDEVAALYRTVMARELEPGLGVHLGERAVRFHGEWFEDPAPLADVLGRVLVLDPSQTWAFDRLSMQLTVAERWGELLGLYDRVLPATTDTARRIILLNEAAHAAKDFAGDADRAIRYLTELSTLKPNDLHVASSLERLLEREERFADLVQFWTARLSLAEHDAAQTLRARIAICHLDNLGDSTSALDAALPLLEDPRHQGTAVGILARLSTSPATTEDTRRRALDALCAYQASHGRPDEVVRALEASLPVAPPTDRAALHRRIAALLIEQDRAADAVAHLAALVVLEPQNDLARAELHDPAARTGQLATYAKAVADAADACEADAARAGALRVEAARVYEDDLGQVPRAIALYSAVFRAAGPDDATVLAVSRRLRALLDPAAQSGDLLDVYERLAALEPDAADRRESLGLGARLADATGDSTRALGLWRRRLDADAADREALDAVVGLLERAQRYEPLIKALQSRAAAALDDRERREDLTSIATIYAEKLDATAEAIDAWRAVELAFGPDAATTDALDALLGRVGRWKELAELLEAAAARASEPARRVHALHRLGNVYVERLEQHDRAAVCYEAALAVDPTHEGSRAGLATLLGDDSCRAQAARVLAAAFEATDDWTGTLRLLPSRLATATEDRERTALLREAARLCELRGADQAGALDAVAKAVALSPEDPELEAELLRLAQATGAWKVASDGYRAAIPRAEGSARVAALRLQHGVLLETRLDDLPGALEEYLAMQALVPESLPAAQASARVAARTGKWDVASRALLESARVLGHVETALFGELETAASDADAWDTAANALWTALDATNGDGAQALDASVARDTGMVVAAWHRDRREDFAAAEQTLVATIHRAGPSVAALCALGDLQRRAPSLALVDTLLALADAGHEPLESLREAAEIALLLQTAGNQALASTILERLLALASDGWTHAEPDALPYQAFASFAIEQLVRLSIAEHDFARALRVLTEGARLPFSASETLGLTHRAAAIAADDLHDADRAIELYRGILTGAPSDSEAIERLGSIYEAEGRVDDLVALRRHQIRLALDTRATGAAPPTSAEPLAQLDELDAFSDAAADVAAPATSASTPSRRDDEEHRVALRLDIAALLGRTGDLAGRIDALRENLAERPGHLASIDELVHVLGEADRFGDLCDLLTEQAAAVETRAQRDDARSLWTRVGVLAEEQLHDVGRAIAAHERAVSLGETAASLDALARLHSARGEHAAAVDALERRAALTEPADRARIASQLANALVAADRPERARICLAETLAADPDASALRQQLAALYRSSEAWEDLVQALVDGADHTDDLERKLAYLRDAADVELGKRKSPATAIPLLERAAELSPKDRTTRTQLADAFRETGRLDEAQARFAELIEEFGRRRPPERAELHFRLAQVERARGDNAEARAQLELATGMDVGHATAFRALGDLYRDEGELERAERAYRALLLILSRRAREPGEASGASEVLLELYRIATKLGRTERASEVLASAFDAASDSDAESRIFERALVAAGEPELTLRALTTRLAHAPSAAASALVLSDMADLHETLGRPDEALEARLRALSAAPESAACHAAARSAAARAGASERYTNTLAELAARAHTETDSDLAYQLEVRLGEALETDVGAKGPARDAFRRAERTGAPTLPLLRAIDRLCGELEDREGQLSALRQIVLAGGDEADPARQTDDLYRLARMELASSETLEHGIDTLVWALDREARNEDAATMLERAAKLRAEPSLLALYERIARANGDKALLLDALERSSLLDTISLDSLREAYELATALEEGARAEALLLRAVEIAETEGNEAGAAWALGALADGHERTGDLAGAVGFLRRAADHAEPGESLRLSLRVAALATGPLEDLPLAIETYERVYEREPGDKSIWEPLLAAYRRRGDADSLEARLVGVIDNVFEAEDRARLRLERAQLLLARGDRDDDAMVALRELLDEDPGHDEAGELLVGVCERLGRDDALADLLSRRLDAARDRKATASIETLALRLAALHAPTRAADARDVLRGALRDADGSRPLLEALLALLVGDDDASERADVLERLLAFDSGPEASQRALALADARSALSDDAGVERALETAFRAQPENASTRARLSQWYEEHSRFAQLAGLISLEAAALTDAHAAATRLREAAAIFRDRLDDPQAAARELHAALDRTPDDVVLVAEYARCLAKTAAHDDAAAAVKTALDSRAAGTPERIELLRLHAELRGLAGDETQALADLELGFEEAPSVVGPDLVATLERGRAHAAATGDAAAERTATLRLCDVATRLGDAERALILLSEWVARAPDDVGALRALLEFEVASGRWDDAAGLADRLVRLERGDERVVAALRLVEAVGQLGRPDAARDALELMFREEPNETRIHAPLAAIYEQLGAHRELAELCVASAGLQTVEEERFSLLRRAGHHWLHGAHAPEQAIATLLEAIQLRGDDHDTIVLLTDAHLQAGQLREATALLDAAIAAHRGRRSRELAVLQQRMARVAYATGDRNIEVAWLNAALDSDKQNVEIASELADVAQVVDNTELALKALRTITSMKGATATVRAVAMLRQGRIAFRQGDVRRAVLMAKKAQSEDPELADTATFLAEISSS